MERTDADIFVDRYCMYHTDKRCTWEGCGQYSHQHNFLCETHGVKMAEKVARWVASTVQKDFAMKEEEAVVKEEEEAAVKEEEAAAKVVEDCGSDSTTYLLFPTTDFGRKLCGWEECRNLTDGTYCLEHRCRGCARARADSKSFHCFRHLKRRYLVR